MRQLRRYTGLVAALLLALLGGLLTGSSVLGRILLVGGGALAVWQGVSLWQERSRRYDLRTLYDSPFPEDMQPEELSTLDPEMVYCHRCGHAVPPPFARCPDCGTSLR